MSRVQEYECLIALWDFIAHQYALTRNVVYLQYLTDVARLCDGLKPTIFHSAATNPLGRFHNFILPKYNRLIQH